MPLPQRTQTSSKIQTAVAIRDGRKAAQRLSVLAGRSTGSTFSGKSISGTSSNVRSPYRRTSLLSTVLEQDFTVQGKKSSLLCPFTRPSDTMNSTIIQTHSQDSGTLNSDPLTPSDMKDTTRHQSADPICAALYAETVNSPPPSASGSAAKCPIRYMDQHSPEEVARYFEIHKHEIPRSHEVCVKRYQRNEDDIRKLDAKYGNLVSMIQGLGQKHQPMLPLDEQQEAIDLERSSNERVENWAQAVSTEGSGLEVEAVSELPEATEEREGRFDRPLKEIRVGESPSRPWGISVPIYDSPEQQRAVSPPPAPVPIHIAPKATPVPISIVPRATPTLVNIAPVSSGKCPFGHSQPPTKPAASMPQESAGRCPFPQAAKANDMQSAPILDPAPAGRCPFPRANANDAQLAPTVESTPAPAVISQPTFIQVPEVSRIADTTQSGGSPQMIFTGPVFIGYPMEQALAFMQQYKGAGTQ